MIMIKTAEEKRQELAWLKDKREDMAALRKIKISQSIDRIFAKVAKEINQMKADKCYVEIMREDLGYTDSIADEVIAKIENLVQQLGYTVSNYTYSRSWQSKSGKYSFLTISFEL